MNDPQPPYPIKLPITWPDDTVFSELPRPIQKIILRAIKKGSIS